MALAGFLDAAHRRVKDGAYADDGPALRPNGSLVESLRRPGARILAELKPASPSEGKLLQRPVEAQLAAYRAGGAAGVSVLTDSDFFAGSIEHLRTAHATGLPTLMKDFVVSEEQIIAAHKAGASAVLLIERAFRGRPQERETLVDAAHAHGLEVLLELFDAEEWDSARSSKAVLFGVNARDLDTLGVDTHATMGLLKSVSAERPVVALSGIHDRAGVAAARAAGATAALVGTRLMRSRDPELTLRGLQRPLAKVCGIRGNADLDAATRAGADLVGFVVGSPDSPRNLDLPEAGRLCRAARTAGVRSVLVTRHGEPADVTSWCKSMRPDYVQVHGFRPEARWIEVQHGGLVGVISAVRTGVDVGSALPEGDAILVDSGRGGTGEVADWAGARTILAGAGDRLSLIGGGLSAENAVAALQATGAWGADASSRLESAPGRKEPVLIRAFVTAVHAS